MLTPFNLSICEVEEQDQVFRGTHFHVVIQGQPGLHVALSQINISVALIKILSIQILLSVRISW